MILIADNFQQKSKIVIMNDINDEYPFLLKKVIR